MNLISKGDFKKYLIYAIGEIALVMIGILLALQVNTWNENRTNKRAENKAIKNLINEFERNHKDLIRVYNAKKDSEKGLQNYLVTLNNDNLTSAEITSVARPDIGGYTWNSTNPMLNSLLSTGKLDNLQNDSLKFMLTSWNDLVDDYMEQQSIYNQIDIPSLIEYENEKIPLKVFKGNYTMESTSEHYISNLDLSKNRAGIVKELEYHNKLINCINRLYIQVMSAQDVIETSIQIQKMLEEEVSIN